MKKSNDAAILAAFRALESAEPDACDLIPRTAEKLGVSDDRVMDVLEAEGERKEAAKPAGAPAPAVITRPGVRLEDSISLAGLPREVLFEDVAGQFENLEQPLSMTWMQARGITLEELGALSQKIALILRGYCALEPRDRIAFISAGLFRARPVESKPAETTLGMRHADASASETKKPEKR